MNRSCKESFRRFFIQELEKRKLNEKYSKINKKLTETKRNVMGELHSFFEQNPHIKALKVSDNCYIKPSYSYTQVVLKPEHFNKNQIRVVLTSDRSTDEKVRELTNLLNKARTRRKETVSTTNVAPKQFSTPPNTQCQMLASTLQKVQSAMQQIRGEKKKRHETILQAGGQGDRSQDMDQIQRFLQSQNRKKLNLSMTIGNKPSKFTVKLFDSSCAKKVSKKRLGELISALLKKGCRDARDFQTQLLETMKQEKKEVKNTVKCSKITVK